MNEIMSFFELNPRELWCLIIGLFMGGTSVILSYMFLRWTFEEGKEHKCPTIIKVN